jgi:hypothetical protein
MIGIAVPMENIISQRVDIVTLGAELSENVLCSKPRKAILKNNNKFDFKKKFSQISDLIKTKKKIE